MKVCAICGGSLAGLRSDARCCSSRCRADASRLNRLLRGETADGYRSVNHWIAARRRRTQGPWEHGDDGGHGEGSG